MTTPMTTHRLFTAPLACRLMISLVVLMLTGCGQTGPLYLPDDNGQVIIREGAASTPATPPDKPSRPPQPQR